MTVTPERLQEIWKEEAQACVDFWDAGIEEFLEQGWFFIEMTRSSKDLLDTFIHWTYPEDVPLVRNPDYQQLRLAGAAPELRANVEFQQLLATAGQPSDYRPFMWALALMIPPWFTWLQRRFIAVEKKVRDAA